MKIEPRIDQDAVEMSSAQILEERPIGRTMLGQGKPPRDQREAREAHYLDARLMGNPRTKPLRYRW